MIARYMLRLLNEVSMRALLKVSLNLCFKNIINIARFERRQRLQQPFFPGFMIISLTTRCNLSCEGCWVTTESKTDLPYTSLRKVIEDSMRMGSTYFGLVGGEPLLYPHLFQIFEDFPGAYFQVFTNGTLLTDDIARKFQRYGNVTPLISIEGLEDESDRRRNGHGVYMSALTALENCRRHKLLVGVASSVCQGNYDDLVKDSFIEGLIERGAHYLWYYIYRPVGARPHPERALNKEQIVGLRKFMVEARPRHPIGIIDTYWDADGKAVCPGAMGLSHHLNPEGFVEFCPPFQFSFDRLADKGSLVELMNNADKLEQLRQMIAEETRGCILLNNPEKLYAWLNQLQAIDSSGRNSAYAELEAMRAVPCHHIADCEIPEKSLIYRIAKRLSFFGFSAYG